MNKPIVAHGQSKDLSGRLPISANVPIPSPVALLEYLLDPFITILSLFIVIHAHQIPFEGPYVVLTVITFLISCVIFEQSDICRSWLYGGLWSRGRSVLISWIFLAGILLFLGYATKSSDEFSRRVIFTWLLITPPLILLSNAFAKGLISKFFRLKKNTRSVNSNEYKKAISMGSPIQTNYVLILKKIVIIDVMALAGFYILRVVGGLAAIQAEISYWMVICIGLLALFLGFSKRRHEIKILTKKATVHRSVLAHYDIYFIDQMIVVITAAILMSYTLYTVDPSTAMRFGTYQLIWTTPFVYYGIFRYFYNVHCRGKGGDPVRLLLADPAMITNGVLWIISCIFIIYTMK